MWTFGRVNHWCAGALFSSSLRGEKKKKKKTKKTHFSLYACPPQRTLTHTGWFFLSVAVCEGMRSWTTAGQRFSIKIPPSYLEQELIRTVNAGRSEGQCVPAAL